MAYGLGIIGLIALGSLLYGVYLRLSGATSNGNTADWFWSGIVTISIVLVIGSIVYTANLASVKKLETAYHVNIDNYQYTVEQTRDLLSADGSGGTFIAGSLEKLEQGKAISEALYKQRLDINHFNGRLASNRAWCSSPIAWPLIPCADDEVQPISLRSSR